MAAMPHEPAAPEAPSAPIDRVTLIALTVLAGAAGTMLHEALGHGGACWLSGGHNLLISTVNENCTVINNWIAAAGTLVNLGAGAVSWWWMRRVRRHAVRLRMFLWLLMTFNLLAGAGYFLFSGIGNLGDWAVILAGHHPAWLWHAGMAVGGGIAYYLFVMLAAHELRVFLPAGEERIAQARSLMLTAYFTYGILSVVAGAFNPVGAVLIAESAAAASFGGASGLCWGWQFLKSPAPAPRPPALPPLRRSRAWLIAGACAAAVFIATVGPGLHP